MYIKRLIEKDIKKVLKRKEIIAIVGARQAGKTTTINHILDNIKNKKINRISFDNIKLKQAFQEDIEYFIETQVKNYDILFIDEIQYVKDSGKILKRIYDNENIKIIISGSSAPELSIQSLKYLVGRVLIYKLYPFNFEEYLTATRPELVNLYKKRKYKQITLKELNKERKKFMKYGGYPEVVLEKDKKIKKQILENIYNTYLLREIKELLHLSENNKLIKLLKLLALQTSKINYANISQKTGFSQPTLKKYLNILEKTYICKKVKPFFTNKKKEIIKNPRVYFYDFGFRNACLDNYSSMRTDIGKIQEQYILTELIKKGINLKYWRTKSKAEVDFIMEKNNKIIPIEVKNELVSSKASRSFMSFLKKYNPDKNFILSENFEKEVKKQGKTITFLPFVKLDKILNF